MIEIMSRSFKSRQELLDYVLNEILRLTQSRYRYIYLYEEESQKARPQRLFEGFPRGHDPCRGVPHR